ncbi:hypothetical protein WKH56_20355 [Priestia sp. SB1]|uniref:hypothetical protein n=1 Tax=Priestia sp. SB1 TaxID=3132359 RepID=UPI003172922E
MEEMLKQILTKLNGLKQGQKEMKEDFKNLSDKVDNIEKAVNRIEVSQNEDVIAILKRVDQDIEDKTQALNKRVYKLETEYERLSRN